jgi:hypothetical protein
MTNYVTSDIFKAAALSLESGNYPIGFYSTDETIGGRPIIYMNWDTMPDFLIEQYQTDKMLINPREFVKAYRRIRGGISQKIKELQNERTASNKSG